MGIEIVDREREIEQLRRLAATPPALVILRGRRRVGKTHLLRAALTGERVVHFQAEERPLALQLEALARECGRLLPAAPPLAFADWTQALEFFEGQARAAGPLVTALDEFQYLAASDPGLLSTVQRFWDRWEASGVPILLVLSGSALGFMAGLLSGAQPTFGRSIYRPLLLPLTYRESAHFAAAGATSIELIERFAVIGGTPQYQRWVGRRSLPRALRDVILPPDAALHSEPQHLIRQEEGVRDPGPYFGTLQSIADGYTSPSPIGGRLQIAQQLASHYLSRLEELGYVARVEPLEPGRKGRARSYWKIADPYLRFWFRYVFPNRSRLERGRIEEVALEIEGDLATFVGPVFEDCCRAWVGRYSELGGGAREVGSWWSRKSDLEVDVVTLERDGYGLLGACKWSSRAVGEGTLEELYAARAVLGPKAARARLAIFARSGFTRGLRRRAETERVHLIEVGQLF